MTKLGKKLFATFMIFVDKLDPFARKKVAYFLTTEEKELKKGLLARRCFQKSTLKIGHEKGLVS